MLPAFEEFPKIPRLRRGCVITEKIDGTNAGVFIAEDGLTVHASSRTRWITPEDDNFGFAAWVKEHAGELLTLGPGMHFGEWWGAGIQRRYGLDHKRFSLFNTSRWGGSKAGTRPACCDVVPVIRGCEFSDQAITETLDALRTNGSLASPGFMRPEGIVVYHPASKGMFKVTCENDAEGKEAMARRIAHQEQAS
jgi:hypothetical protein